MFLEFVDFGVQFFAFVDFGVVDFGAYVGYAGAFVGYDVAQLLLDGSGAGAQSVVVQGGNLWINGFDFVHYRHDFFQIALRFVAENFG